MRSSSNNSVGYTKLFDENSVPSHIVNWDRIELNLSPGNFYSFKIECYVKIGC